MRNATLEWDYAEAIISAAGTVSIDQEFPAGLELGDTVMVGFARGGGIGYAMGTVTDYSHPGSAYESMASSERRALSEEERYEAERSPGTLTLAMDSGDTVTYDIGDGDAEAYLVTDGALEEAAVAVSTLRGEVPQPGETALLTTTGDDGWGLYVSGRLDASGTSDAGIDASMSEHLEDGEAWDEYRVSAASAAAGFPQALGDIPLSAYARS